jgi:hypothetical protein
VRYKSTSYGRMTYKEGTQPRLIWESCDLPKGVRELQIFRRQSNHSIRISTGPAIPKKAGQDYKYPSPVTWKREDTLERAYL